MEALDAFRVVQIIEEEYALVPREAGMGDVSIESPAQAHQLHEVPAPAPPEVRLSGKGPVELVLSDKVTDDSETVIATI